jgi:hypothetical protein
MVYQFFNKNIKNEGLERGVMIIDGFFDKKITINAILF